MPVEVCEVVTVEQAIDLFPTSRLGVVILLSESSFTIAFELEIIVKEDNVCFL